MRFHDETWRDRFGRICVGGTAGGVVVWVWAVTAELLLNGPGPHFKGMPRYLISDYACGYGMTAGLAVGAVAGLSGRQRAAFRPPPIALVACCFVVWFVSASLTPAYSRVGPPPLREFTAQVLSSVALALGLGGSIWCVARLFDDHPDKPTTGP